MNNLRNIEAVHAAAELGLKNIDELKTAAAKHGISVMVERDGNLRKEVLSLRDFGILRSEILDERREEQQKRRKQQQQEQLHRPVSSSPQKMIQPYDNSKSRERYSSPSDLIEE